MDFDSHVRPPTPNQHVVKADLITARELIRWAEHLVFVYPTWWGTMPALLKGFLDRVLTPDFASRTCEGGTAYQGLLGGRSAQPVTTMDTPPLIHRPIYRQRLAHPQHRREPVRLRVPGRRGSRLAASTG